MILNGLYGLEKHLLKLFVSFFHRFSLQWTLQRLQERISLSLVAEVKPCCLNCFFLAPLTDSESFKNHTYIHGYMNSI